MERMTMYFYPNKNDVLVVVAPDVNGEDRLALADLQEALGEDVKVVAFTSNVSFTTISRPQPELKYDCIDPEINPINADLLDFPKVG